MSDSYKPAHGVDGINVIILTDGRRVRLDEIATAEEGQGYLDDLDGAIDTIEHQLDDAHRRGWVGPDPGWHQRAGLALKRKRRLRPRLQQRIGELRKAERIAAASRAISSTTPERRDARRKAFIDAAEAMLDRELFVEIWQRASETDPSAFENGGGVST